MKMATLIQYRQQEPDTAKMGVTRDHRGNRTLADAVARRLAPIARARSELAVMEGIAELLGQLTDEAAVGRVLQWVDSVYRQGEPASVAAAVRTPTPAPVLAPAPAPSPTLATPALAPAPVDPVLTEAVWEPKVEALSDSDLRVDDLADWFEQPSASEPPNRPASETGATQPVVSMLHDFVSDFQKLARDWQES